MELSEKNHQLTTILRPIFLVCFGLTFLAFGIPIYAKALGASALEIGGLYTIFSLPILVLRPIIGWGLDRFGRRWFLIAGLGCYTIAMALFALAGNLTGLYLARLVNGIAASFTWTATATIVSDFVGPEQRGQAQGKISEMDARGEIIGGILGLSLFNMIAPQTAWSIAFCSYAILAAISTWLAWKYVPESHPSPRTVKTLINSRIISKPFINLLAIIFTASFSQALILPIYLIYLQDRFSASIGTLALSFLPGGIILGILPSRLGRYSDRYGRSLFMAAGFLGDGILCLLLPQTRSLGILIGLYTLSSIGWSMSIPAEAALIADLAGSDVRGRAYGLYQFMASLGSAVGPMIGGWLYDSFGMSMPFFLTSAILLISAVWVFLALHGFQKGKQKTITS